MQAEDAKIGTSGHAPDAVEIAVAGMHPPGQHKLVGDRCLSRA
jgi:hypothetical protein